MTLAELRTVFRREMGDTLAPFLWSDAELTEFFNDAVLEAVRRGFTILDSTTADICSIAYTTDPVLDLDPRIIALRSVIVRGQSIPLQETTVASMDMLYPGWRTHAAQRYPLFYIKDWGSDKIRLYPAPSVAGTLDLSVAREPLAPMEAADDEPELPPRCHRSLIYWGRYRAYDKDDTETRNQARVDLYERKFSGEFGERKSARNERWAAEQSGASFETLC